MHTQKNHQPFLDSSNAASLPAHAASPAGAVLLSSLPPSADPPPPPPLMRAPPLPTAPNRAPSKRKAREDKPGEAYLDRTGQTHSEKGATAEEVVLV